MVKSSYDKKTTIRGYITQGEFTPKVVIDEDERIHKAECTCHFHRQNQLRKGPCEHILAIRMKANDL